MIVLKIFLILYFVKKFVYFKPNKIMTEISHDYTDIYYKHLHGWFFDEKSDKVILFFHGNKGNISDYINKIDSIKSLGYSIFAFDYSGYGKSSGNISEKQCYNDAEIMIEYALNHYCLDNIIVYGFSLGGSIASYISHKYNIKLLILEAPLPSIKLVIKYRYPFISFITFLFPEFNTEKYLENYTGKLYLIHSTEDETIPYTATKHLEKFAKQVIVTTGSHSNLYIDYQSLDFE